MCKQEHSPSLSIMNISISCSQNTGVFVTYHMHAHLNRHIFFSKHILWKAFTPQLRKQVLLILPCGSLRGLLCMLNAPILFTLPWGSLRGLLYMINVPVLFTLSWGSLRGLIYIYMITVPTSSFWINSFPLCSLNQYSVWCI